MRDRVWRNLCKLSIECDKEIVSGEPVRSDFQLLISSFFALSEDCYTVDLTAVSIQ